jgi:hypothetical protein
MHAAHSGLLLEPLRTAYTWNSALHGEFIASEEVGPRFGLHTHKRTSMLASRAGWPQIRPPLRLEEYSEWW